jgi:hypothetical protein
MYSQIKREVQEEMDKDPNFRDDGFLTLKSLDAELKVVTKGIACLSTAFLSGFSLALGIQKENPLKAGLVSAVCGTMAVALFLNVRKNVTRSFLLSEVEAKRTEEKVANLVDHHEMVEQIK